jgi:aspartyl-tRNA synthetase
MAKKEQAVFPLGSYRSHVCGDVHTLENGTQVTLAGWVDRLRQLGGVTFLDLMDRYGKVQCVLGAEGGLPQVSRFDVVQVTGIIYEKRKKNPDDLGSLKEVQCAQIKVLSATRPLPFSMDKESTSEQTRLTYRYLDLRRPDMWRRFQLRSEINEFTRTYFTQKQFLEIETPILYKSTPEGARDFLVPSRLYPGQFYALPQSPQILKQLLMISGMDRYMQIVRCFRDEDLRQNRQPEFTQLDLECAFVTQKDVMDLVEGYIFSLFRQLGKTLSPTKLPRLSYAHAMEIYGCDRPDLRFEDLKYVSIKSLFQQNSFQPFESLMNQPYVDVACLGIPASVLKEVPSRSLLGKWEQVVRDAGMKGLLWVLESGNEIRGSAKGYFTDEVMRQLHTLVGKQAVYLILAGEVERFAAMDGLRKAVIESLQIRPSSEFEGCWVVDFPLFGKTEEGQLAANHHPFTSPDPVHVHTLLAQDVTQDALLRVRAQAYDLVINGEEIGGGSIRVHEPDLQRRMFEVLGLTSEEIQQKFGFMIEALGYGAPPHGGIALGMDRLVALLDGHEVIRDYIAFPKTQNAQCLMSGAPSPVSQDQLEELGLICVPRP